MIQARLNEAAIQLHKVLDEVHIKHGIFGGNAIGVLGGPRESKDIDCLAATSKLAAIALLDGKSGFQCVSQSRTDYVAFLWSEQFPEARYGMQNVAPEPKTVSGQQSPSGMVSLFNPIYLFKGKLRAAATRGKFHDSADIRWLASRFLDRLKAQRSVFNLSHIGLSMKRYPELEVTFHNLRLDVQKAKETVASVQLSQLPPPQRGDVQSGILG
ncbi:hypothetical protein MMC13_004460 [Lambiella insularis]|nr:hypothetical protein [Lambiella insularis]